MLALAGRMPSCLLTRMGIGFCSGGTFARTGLEGVRPCLPFASADALPKPPTGGERDQSSCGGGAQLCCDVAVTSRDATIRIGGFHGDSNDSDRTKREDQR